MAKTATQRQREHIARLRRKAQALDQILSNLKLLEPLTPQPAVDVLRGIIRIGEKAVQE